MKQFIKKIPFVGKIATAINQRITPSKEFTTSENYWVNRYKTGGNSGAGSYNRLAEFKGEIINEFVAKNQISNVIELGCGDGNQLDYFNFPNYVGFDISNLIIKKCQEKFKLDKSRSFEHLSKANNYKSDLVMSLDVIYHLIEDETFSSYMHLLFNLSTKYVVVYSNNDAPEIGRYYAPHVKPRKFTDWIIENQPNFKLIEHIPNRYPFEEEKRDTTSFADFFIYEKMA